MKINKKYLLRLLIAFQILLLSQTLIFPLSQAQNDYSEYLQPPNAEPGGTLVIAEPYEPAHIQPAFSTLSAVKSVGGAIFEPLIYTSADLSTYIPGLAEAWEISEDGTTYTFHLVKDVKWHDGTPFTSADVKFNMEVWKEHHPRLKKAIDPLDRIETPDDHTVVVIFKKSWTPFLSGVAFGDAVISMPKHLYEGTDIFNNPYNNEPVGTGAYKLKEWAIGSHITLERNDDYRISNQPYIDTIIFRYMPDEVARLSAFETGEAYLLTAEAHMSVASYQVLEKLPNTKLEDHGILLSLPVPLPLIFNLDHDIVDNKKVRQAIAWAIDKDAIIDSVYRGLAKRMVVFFTEDSPWHNPDIKEYYPRDLDKANQLLDDAGYLRGTDGVRFELKYTYDHAMDVENKPAQVIIANLKEVGIEVIDSGGESRPTWEQIFLRHDFDIASVRYGTGPDPYIGISRMYFSTNIGDALFNNGAEYNNSEVDDLWTNIASTPDMMERRELYWQLQEIVQEDLPYAWLVDGTTAQRVVYRDDKLANVNTWCDDASFAMHTIYFIPEEPTPTDGEGGTDYTLVAGVGIVLLIVGVAVGYYLSRRR